MGAAKKTEVVTAKVDQAEVFKQLAIIKKEIDAVQAVEVPELLETPEQYKDACSLLIGVVERRKYAEAEREGFMEDVQKMIERVNGWFDPVLKPLDELEANLRNSVTAYALALHEEAMGFRRAAARVKDEKRCRALIKQADEAVPPKVPGIAITTKPKVQITDESSIPDKFTKRVPDLKLIQAELEAGRAVTGAILDTTKGVTVTPKNAKKDE